MWSRAVETLKSILLILFIKDNVGRFLNIWQRAGFAGIYKLVAQVNHLI